MRNPRRTKRVGQPLRLESLENRWMLDGDGVMWGADARLTLSFAPDETLVADTASELFAKMDALAPRHEWQAEILRGFQTWARETNGDIGLVSDDGSDFGTDGLTNHDPRFGDIRVAAIPLDNEMIATSVSSAEVIDGTWTGDLLFNSNFSFANLDEVFAVALHEAGHIFGLEHNQDPLSPMYEGYASTIPTALVTPTADDLTALHDVYGPRSPDLFDLENEEPTERITILPAFKVENGESGSAPTLLFGDITSEADFDLYETRPIMGYTGTISVELISTGISQLAPHLTITAEDGSIVADVSSASGVDTTIQLGPQYAADRLGIRVEADGQDEFAIGGYTLLVRYDDLNEVPAASLAEIVRYPIRHVELDDLIEYFEDGQQLLANDDDGSDDGPGMEMQLDTVPGFAEGTRYQVFASIENADDVDRYLVTTPETFTADRDWARLSLRALDGNPFEGRINFYDVTNQELLTEVLVHNSSTHIVQTDGLLPDHDYIITVQRGANSGADAGNYELDILLGTREIARTNFVEGSLHSELDRDLHSLRLARPQLFHFNLTAAESTASDVTLTMKILDRRGKVIAALSTQPGDSRTASFFLPQGRFRVVITADSAEGFTDLDYRLSGQAVDDPLGPRSHDPTDTPFAFDDDKAVIYLVFAFSGF